MRLLAVFPESPAFCILDKDFSKQKIVTNLKQSLPSSIAEYITCSPYFWFHSYNFLHLKVDRISYLVYNVLWSGGIVCLTVPESLD